MKDETAKEAAIENLRKLFLEARLEEIESVLALCKEDFVPSAGFNEKMDKIMKDITENKNTK